MSLTYILQKKRKHISWHALLGSIAAVLLISVCGTFAGTTNALPPGFIDTFEAYPNLTPLVEGTNGWYGSSTSVIAQAAIYFSGARAAMIPVDCTLSNRFRTDMVSTNVCVQMDVRPCLYDGTNVPVVDTNAALMFYVNSNGYFVVHNGPVSPDATNSTNWVTIQTNMLGTAATPVLSNDWVRVKVYEDFSQTNWSLTVNRVLLTNNIAFINPTLTNFAGFDLYNGSATSYLDNVNVSGTTNLADLAAVPLQLTNSVMLGKTPTPATQTFTVTNSGPEIAYNVNVGNLTWLSSYQTSGTLAANSSTEFLLVYSNIPSTWAAGVSNQVVSITTTNFDGTQVVASVNVTLNIMDLQVTPLYLTNSVWVGEVPAPQTFSVQNAGGGSFTYTTQTGASWIACSSNAGTLGANSSNTLTLNYASTAGWAAGTSNTTVTIASTDGGGASRTLNVTLYVNNLQTCMQVTPTNLTQTVTVRQAPTNMSFIVSNTGASTFNYTVTNTEWLSGTSTNKTLGPFSSTNITVVFSPAISNWPVSISNTTIAVSSTNGGGVTNNISVWMNVVPSNQNITYTPIGDQWATNTVVLTNATASSGLPVTYSVGSGPGVITTSNLTFTNSGSVTIVYSQAGDTNWAPAASLSNTFSVSKVTAAVTLSNLTQVYNGSPRVVTYGTTPTGLTASITYDGSATPPVNAGSNAVVGTIVDGRYTGMAVGTLVISKADQTITFPAIPAQPSGNSNLTLSATASSGLTVAFTNGGGTLGTNIVGTLLTFNGTGEYTIVASQAGNSNWNAASPVSQTFPVYGYTNGQVGTSNTIPWFDTFETYFNLQPLINGTNGWYGSSSSILVQTNVFCPGGGIKAATVPVDCTLSNLFAINGQTNVWLQMDLLPAFYDSTNPPTVDTNVVAMFYVDSNGYFAAHNGVTTNASASTNWVTFRTNAVSSNAWVRVHVFQNYRATNWALFVNRVLLTNNLGFINPAITNFNGFNLYNGSTTSYLDNVYVTATNPSDLMTNANNWLPGLAVNPTGLTNSVFKGKTLTANGSFNVWQTNGVDALGYTISTNVAWLSASPSAGVLAGTTQAVALTYSGGATVGTYAGQVTVTGYDASFGYTASNSPQTISVWMNVMDLQANPASLVQTVTVRQAPTNMSFAVANGGAGAFNFTVTNTEWLSGTCTNGSLGPYSSTNITVVFSSAISNWLACISNTTITVSSTDGGGATTNISVQMNVVASNQTITFPHIDDQLTTNTVVLSATASSGLPVTFSATAPGVLTGGTNLTFTNAGSVTVVASQAGDTNWAAAPSVSNTFAVLKVTAVVTLSNLTQVYNGSPRVVTASTMPTGKVVSITYNGSASAPVNAGSYSVTGTVVDGQYDGIAVETLVVSQATQTITFPAIPAQPSGNLTLTLSATASSGLAVTFTNGGGTLGTNIVGTLLTFNGTGEYTIVASQTGNVNYSAATPVSQTFPVYGYTNGQVGTLNNIPWSDDFETYFNLQPLINGTNGWYGSSSDILVQTDVVCPGGGIKAAKIPVDCTLSNRFWPNSQTNVWIKMDLCPAFYNSSNPPTVDTNVVDMFYVDSNGYFAAHNGTTTNASASTNWVTFRTNAVSSGAWVRVHVYQNYRATNWALFVNWVLLTNNLGFINPAITNFNGFNLYNGSTTSYLDNVVVTNNMPSDLATNGNNWLPVLAVDPMAVASSVFKDRSVTTSNSFGVWRTNGADAMGFTIATNASWLSAAPVAGSVAGTTQAVDLTYNAAGKVGGSYTGLVTVTGYDALFGLTASNSPQTVTALMNVMDMRASPTVLTNMVLLGNTPADQSFTVSNDGEGSFNYIVTNAEWLSGTCTNGTLGPHESDVITVKYASTAGWGIGVSNSMIMVVSPDGGGATQYVDVVLNVTGLQVIPMTLSNTVMVGWAPAPQTNQLINLGAGAFNYTVTVTNNWLSCAPTSGTLAAYSTNLCVVTYSNTTGWTPGDTSNTTILIASTDDGGTSLAVNVSLTVVGRATNFYVATNGLSIGPYTNWATAATNLQDAVNAAIVNGDHVLVSNGVFTLASQVVVTNGIIIDGVYGRTSTFIDGNYPSAMNRCFYVAHSNAIVQGFTIRNGCATAGGGGGVWLTNNATLRDCILNANRAINSDGCGGGVYIAGAGMVTGCVIYGNTSSGDILDHGGGGVECFNGGLVLNCQISNNVSAHAGGGVNIIGGGVIRDCNPIADNISMGAVPEGGGGVQIRDITGLAMISNCTIIGNASVGLAGGLMLDSYGMAYNCQISNNVAQWGGGGALVRNNSAIWNSTIASNRAWASGAQGGGVMLGESAGDTSTVWNCSVVNNSAFIGGGLDAASGRARSCLIYNNSAGLAGGGVYIAESSDAAIQNCTISSNNNYGVYILDGTTIGSVENSIIYSNATVNLFLGGTNSTFTNCCTTPTNGIIGSGNITNDPAFANFAGGNLRLSAISPCINAGTNQSWMIGMRDLDGLPRIIGPRVDIGAYEYPSSWSVIPSTLINQVMVEHTPTNQGFAIVNQSAETLYYQVFTNAPWVSLNSNSGTLGAYETAALVISYGAATGWTPGTSNATVTVVATNDVSPIPQTQTVAVVMNVMQLQVAPTSLTKDVMRGLSAVQTFDVADLGNGLLSYTVSTNSYNWVGISPDNGILTNASTNTIAVTYAPTLPNGVTTGMLTVASSSGGGATQTVDLTVNVMELLRTPGNLVNSVIPGYTPTLQGFTMWNGGAGTFNYSISSDASWVALVPNSGTLGAYSTNAITVVYSATTGWSPGTSNATVTIVSTNGGGATQTVAIVIYVSGLLPPAGVVASKGTYTDKVLVTWDVVTNAAGYQVWRNTANDTATAINLGALAGTSYDDAAAVQEVVYYYWIKSTNSLGVSAFSTPDSGYRNLYPPSGLTATKGTYTDKVALSWTAAAGAVGYEIWRSTSSDVSTAAKISGSDVVGTSYNDTGTTNGVHYTYWVKTKGASGIASAFSSSDTGWRGVPSPTVSASKGLRREVKVTWTASPGAEHYQLWRNIVDESSTAALVTTIDTTSYRDMPLLPGIYYYWVKALSTLGGDSGMGTSAYGLCSGGKWDFNGDGRAEVWYYHEESGRWYIMMTINVLSTTVLGGPGWAAVPADYDGDGITDLAVYEAASGTWQAKLSGRGGELVEVTRFGSTGYVAVVGDYDADGKADPAIYYEPSGIWYSALSGSGYQLAGCSGFGMPGYIAVPADFDGDGKTDPAIYGVDSGHWFMALSGNGYRISSVFHFGQTGFTPVPGEYLGLGYSQIAVYNDVSGNWYICTAPDEFAVVFFGQAGYVPMPADYDADKYEDECVFYRTTHDAIWYLLKSTEGFQMISGRMSRPIVVQ